MNKIHTFQTRSWINRELQHFLGRYRQSSCGLYVMDDMATDVEERIVSTFNRCPEPLRLLALDAELTVSLSLFSHTKAGNSCTIYGAWRNLTPRDISPHLEVGQVSLPGRLLLPHMVHELSHLFWKTRSLKQTLVYRSFLCSSMSTTDREVTPYADEHFREYLRFAEVSGRLFDCEADSGAFRHLGYVEESFCETVAKLRAPGYPYQRDWQESVDLALRRKHIRMDTGLRI
ncbi:MAG: hypothetical protein K8F91_23925 [Candidatus Obscuribacterales bacterium]|nr:hypothetical protein [Candidatus Obscuribacterales bacterium]